MTETKILKGDEFMKLTPEEQDEKLKGLLGADKFDKQTNVSFSASLLPEKVEFSFVDIAGKGEENGNIRGREVDTRYISFIAKTENESDLIPYSVVASNLWFRGVIYNVDKLLEEKDLEQWEKQDEGGEKRSGLYIKGAENVNDFLPRTPRELSRLLLNPKAKFKAKKVIYNNLRFAQNQTNKEQAIKEMSKRTVYKLEMISKS